jgi:hypothetical protein
MKLIKTTRVFEITQRELDKINTAESACDLNFIDSCEICKYKEAFNCPSGQFELAPDITFKIIKLEVELEHLMNVSELQFKEAPYQIIAVMAVNSCNPDTYYNVFYYNCSQLTYSTNRKDGIWALNCPSKTDYQSNNAFDIIIKEDI